MLNTGFSVVVSIHVSNSLACPIAIAGHSGAHTHCGIPDSYQEQDNAMLDR